MNPLDKHRPLIVKFEKEVQSNFDFKPEGIIKYQEANGSLVLSGFDDPNNEIPESTRDRIRKLFVKHFPFSPVH